MQIGAETLFKNYSTEDRKLAIEICDRAFPRPTKSEFISQQPAPSSTLLQTIELLTLYLGDLDKLQQSTMPIGEISTHLNAWF